MRRRAKRGVARATPWVVAGGLIVLGLVIFAYGFLDQLACTIPCQTVYPGNPLEVFMGGLLAVAGGLLLVGQHRYGAEARRETEE